MKNLAKEPAVIDWLELAAVGPFSYCWHRMHLTHAGGQTVQSTTYASMIRFGWVQKEF